MKENTLNVIQRVFANGASGHSKCHQFTAVHVQIILSFYWFAQTLSFFHITLQGPRLEYVKIAFVQKFETIFPDDAIGQELIVARLWWATDDILENFDNFDIPI